MGHVRGLWIGGLALLLAACGGPPQNGSPTAGNDELTTAEGTAATVDVLSNDADPDGDTLLISAVTDGEHGTAAVAANGQVRFTPASGFNGKDAFTYTVTDGKGATATGTVNVTVTAIADAPVAEGDSYSTTEDTPLVVAVADGVLSNDKDSDSTSLTASVVTPPANGNLEFSASGAFTYTPNANFNGRDFFIYSVSDGSGSSKATVTLTVGAVNDAPVATADVFDLIEDTAFNSPRSLLTNDTDPDDNGLTAVIVAQPSSGTLSLQTDGTFSYTPGANVNGAVTFTYKVNDGTADSAPATVTFNLAAVNDAPSFTKGADVTVAEDSAATNQAGWATAISAGPADESSQTLTFNVATSNPSLFSAVPAISSAGALSFTPAANSNGTATVTVTLTDSAGATSAAQTFTVTITAVNDAPSFIKGADVTVAEDSGPQLIPGWATGISAGAPDESAQTLTFTVAAVPSSLFSAQPALSSSGTLSFTPAANQNGTAVVTVTLSDSATGTSAAQTFNLAVTAVNDAPVAANDSYSTAEDTTLTQAAPGVLANDSDTESSALAAVVASGPSHGTLTLNANGSFTYVPNANYSGPDSFRYTASDGAGSSNTAEVALTVAAVNDAPVATADSYALVEDSPLTVAATSGVLGNDRDVDSASLTAVLVAQGSKGLVTLNADGSFTYTPNADSNGADSFTYKANDGTTDSSTVTVSLTISAVNDAPSFTKGADRTVAEDSGAANQAFATAISAGPSDESSQTVSFTVTNSNAALFSVQPAIASNGALSFTPAPNANGVATVTVVLTDSAGATSAPQTFSITVTPVNDAPSFSLAAAPDITLGEDNGTYGDLQFARFVSAGPPDEASQTLTFNVTHNNAALFSQPPTVSSSGVLLFTPAANAAGTALVTVTLTDSGGTANGGLNTSSARTFNLTINPVNDQPTFVGGPVLAYEDVPFSLPNWATNLSAGAPNEAAQALAFSATTNNPALFTTQPTVSPAGDLSFATAPEASGDVNLTVTLTDNGGTLNGGVDTLTRVYALKIAPVNDAPSFVAGSNVTVQEDSGSYSGTWATGMNRGAANESSQALSFVVTNDNNALFAVQPSVASDGVLTFTPAPDAFGSARVTVILRDDGGTANGGRDASSPAVFTVTVNDVPDVPVAVDDTAATTAGVQIDVDVLANDTGLAPLSLAAIVMPPAVGTANIVANKLRYTPPAPPFSGTVTIDYEVRDAANMPDTGRLTIAISDDTTAPMWLSSTPSTGGTYNAATYSSAVPVTFAFNEPINCPSVTVEVKRNGVQVPSTEWNKNCPGGPVTQFGVFVNTLGLPVNATGDNWEINLTNVRDLANNVGSAVAWTALVDAAPPSFTWDGDPFMGGLRPNTRVLVTFNEPMNTASSSTLVFAPSGTTTNVPVEPDDGIVLGTGWVKRNGFTDSFIYVPRDLLTNGNWDISIAGFTDLAGNPVGNAGARMNLALSSGGGGSTLPSPARRFVDTANATVFSAPPLDNDAFLAPSSLGGTSHRLVFVFDRSLNPFNGNVPRLRYDDPNGNGNEWSATLGTTVTTNDTVVFDVGTTPWSAGGQYRVSLSVSASSGSNQLYWNEETRFSIQKSAAATDTTQPTVTAWSARRTVAGSATPLVRPEEPLVATFSEAVDFRSLKSSNVTIKQGSVTYATKTLLMTDGGPFAASIQILPADAAGATIALAPGLYTVELRNIADLANNGGVQNVNPLQSSTFQVGTLGAASFNKLGSSPNNVDASKIQQWAQITLSFDDAVSLASLTDTGAGPRGFRLEEEWFPGQWVAKKGLTPFPMNTSTGNDRAGLSPKQIVQLSNNTPLGEGFAGGKSYRFTLKGGAKNIDGLALAGTSQNTVQFMAAPTTATDLRPALGGVSGQLEQWTGGIVFGTQTFTTNARLGVWFQDNMPTPPLTASWTVSADLNAQQKSSTTSQTFFDLNFTDTEVSAYFVDGRNDITLKVTDDATNSISIPEAMWRFKASTLTALTPATGIAGSGRRFFQGTLNDTADAPRLESVDVIVVGYNPSPPTPMATGIGYTGRAQVSRTATGVVTYYLEIPPDRTLGALPSGATEWRALVMGSTSAPVSMGANTSVFSALSGPF